MRCIILAVLLIGFIGCKSNKRPPKDAIKVDKLTVLLLDLHLVEGGKDNAFFFRDSVEAEFLTNYNPVFEAHNTSRDRFLKTYAYYYNNNPAELSNIYQNVLDSLEKIDFIGRPEDIDEMIPKDTLQNNTFLKHRQLDLVEEGVVNE